MTRRMNNIWTLKACEHYTHFSYIIIIIPMDYITLPRRYLLLYIIKYYVSKLIW